MKGPGSPSKKNKRFSASKERSGAKYEPDSLIPQNYEQQLLTQGEQTNPYANSKDAFKKLGVSNEDKMTFFLLKWIFNAIKRDSALDDAKLLGKPYITKGDLVKQLSKNDELMNALGYDAPEDVAQAVKRAASGKDGCLLWEEFLDFFFLRQASLQGIPKSIGGHENSWWRKIGHSDKKDAPPAAEDAEANKKDSPKKNAPRYGGA